MSVVAKQIRILVGVVGLGVLGLILLVKYTDVCRLQAVTLNGQPVPEWNRALGLVSGKQLFEQPVDSVADALLLRNGIVHVDIKFQLPNGLKITTNSLAPVCYMLDESTGVLYGLDETGRVVSLDTAAMDWERPIFTGARVKTLHDFSTDLRMGDLVVQVEKLREGYPTLYPLIEEINLSSPECVTVSISGLAYKLRMKSDHLAERFAEFQKFLEKVKPSTGGVTCFDLTYDDMIIRIGDGQKKKPAELDTSMINDKAEFSDEEPPAATLASLASVQPEVKKPVAAVKPIRPTPPVKAAAKQIRSNSGTPAKKSAPTLKQKTSPTRTIKNAPKSTAPKAPQSPKSKKVAKHG